MADPSPTPPTFAELLRVFLRIGCLSFGGPVGQIALMHREVVAGRGWVSEPQYLAALNFCHLLPGPEAQQLAIWIGWKLPGVKGGLAAGLLFVLPGALVMLALSVLYGFAAHLGWFAAMFLGIKAAVLAVVVQALRRVAGRALDTRCKRIAALLAFIALFVFALPFPLVVLAAAVAGMVIATRRPQWLGLGPSAPGPAAAPRPWRQSLRAVMVGGAAWGLPMLVVRITLGPRHVLWKIGVFFTKLAVFTFGGAYAVLAYMAQQVVSAHHWLGAGEMADGLGLAETTPGPLIMVTQFVGYLAAYRLPAPFTPLVAGVLGALLTTWVTFAPCFLWIFALAPWMERLGHAGRLKGGLALVTAAVVGVIANLSLWFALHVLFARTLAVHRGAMVTVWPDPTSFDVRAAALAVLAAVLLFGRGWSVLRVLAVNALAGVVLMALV